MSARVKVSSKNQVVIPAEIRRKLDIKPGDYLYVAVLDGQMHIVRDPEEWLEYTRGLGRDVWEEVDAEEYINQERDAWEE